MAEVTLLLDPEIQSSIKADMADGTAHGRRNAVRSFIKYLLDEDAHYCIIPKHEYYLSQSTICKTLKKQIEALASVAGVLSASRRYGRTFGRVTAWKSGAFGFIRQNNGEPDAYVHLYDVINPVGDQLKVGSSVEYDIVAHPDRPRAIKVVVLDDDPE
jgi:cold shock CspA family protein